MKKYHKAIKQFPIIRDVAYSIFRTTRGVFWKHRRQFYAANSPPEAVLAHATTALDTLTAESSHRPISLAEIGCNSGALLFTLAERFPSSLCLGLDLQTSAIKFATKRVDKMGLKNLTFRSCDARSYTFMEPIDVLVTSATLIYLANDELLSFLKRAVQSVGRYIILNEVISRSTSTYKSHFFAHPYRELLKLEAFNAFNIEYFPNKQSSWNTEYCEGVTVVLSRKATETPVPGISRNPAPIAHLEEIPGR